GDEVVFQSLLRERRGRAASNRRAVGEAAEVRNSRDGREEKEGRSDAVDRRAAAVREVLRRTSSGENAGVYEDREGHARDKHTATIAADRGGECAAAG